MMKLIDANTTPPGYPKSAADLRAAFPNTSFPDDLTEAILAPFGWHVVILSTRPADTRTQRYLNTVEQQTDGSWLQVWVPQQASQQEIEIWDSTNKPVPDWKTFKRTLLSDPEINVLLGSGIPYVPAASLALPATVINISEGGDLADFRAAWLALRREGLVSYQLLQKVRFLSIQCNMTEEFLSSIGGTVRPSPQFIGQEWISSEGILWVVAQARGENGQFLPDDPNTPEKESLEWVIAE